MPSLAPIEFDMIRAADGVKLGCVTLPVVPRIGEEVDLDLGPEAGGGGVYRVTGVRYHARPRRLVRMDDLLGVSLYVTPAG